MILAFNLWNKVFSKQHCMHVVCHHHHRCLRQPKSKSHLHKKELGPWSARMPWEWAATGHPCWVSSPHNSRYHYCCQLSFSSLSAGLSHARLLVKQCGTCCMQHLCYLCNMGSTGSSIRSISSSTRNNASRLVSYRRIGHWYIREFQPSREKWNFSLTSPID